MGIIGSAGGAGIGGAAASGGTPPLRSSLGRIWRRLPYTRASAPPHVVGGPSGATLASFFLLLLVACGSA
ncbi:hypothetical protein ACP70R_000310 [Stipagrostis hirtigluma subsp. patula]